MDARGHEVRFIPNTEPCLRRIAAGTPEQGGLLIPSSRKRSPSRIRIIPWSDADRNQLLNLCRQMHAESRYAFLPFDVAKVNLVLDLYMQEKRQRCALAAVIGDRVVGAVAGYVTEYAFCSELVASDQIVYVIPRSRGTLAAVRLIEAFRVWARDQGARELVLGITTGVDARRTGELFEKLGFEFAGGNFVQRLNG
jgi:GNAT superfamily N-acetyltransferase